MRDGLYWSVKFRRLNKFLLIDSIFQVREESCNGASVPTDLSDSGSLNDSGSMGVLAADEGGTLTHW